MRSQTTWAEMQQQVAGGNVSGPLDAPAALAEQERAALRGLQRAITTQLEQVRRDELHWPLGAIYSPTRFPRLDQWLLPAGPWMSLALSFSSASAS